MVASQAVMHETPETVVREMSQHIEALAREGDWAEVESMLVRLRGALLNVPEAERHELLTVVQRSTEKVAAQAERAREQVAGRISTLHRGRRATTAYENG